ncbi:MAG TPA: sulfotransferase [Nitrospira sp.]|nr:sulfotransferase [Nitrospira sp.]
MPVRIDERTSMVANNLLKLPIDKAALGRALFALAGISRIHIIGCGRSGTTMLHLALACFRNVTLSTSETSVQYPYLRERLSLTLRLFSVSGRKHYVTKRNSGWTKPDRIDDLIEWTRLENIGIINLVRDPRDVMLSRHAGAARPDLPYISQKRWYDSILATDKVFDSLKDHPRKLTLRYEDLILKPLESQSQIEAAFGVLPNPNALPIDKVKDNFERLRLQYDARELPALNGLRNMDAETVLHWRKSGDAPSFETMTPDMLDRLKRFCEEHGYDRI